MDVARVVPDDEADTGEESAEPAGVGGGDEGGDE
jgi:hypothetical protein